MDKPACDSDAFSFCFIEMPFDDQASMAIRELNGEKLGGHALTVRESGVSI